jgi:23S rRNA (uracil1939-C5)-methyltransferase
MVRQSFEDLEIQRWVNGGDGLAVIESGDDEGLIVFVPGTVPGDRVDVRLTHRKKRWARGVMTRRRDDSGHRVQAKCAVQDACGGCPWMVGDLDLQRAEHRRILVSEVTKRLGRFVSADAAERMVAPRVVHGKSWGYRNRLRMAYSVSSSGQVRLGFRQARGGSIVDVGTCVVAVEELQRAIPRVKAHLESRVNEVGEVRLLAGLEGVAGTIEPKGGKVEPWGPSEVTLHVGRAQLRLGPAAFVQGNSEVAAKIASDVEAKARVAGGTVAVELFCGAGTFTVPLLEAGYKVWGYDVAGECEDAFAKATGSFGEAWFHTQDLLGLSPYPSPPPPAPELILLDPPRTGAGEVVDWIAQTKAGTVLMVSCDLATALRDTARLLEAGFTCVGIQSYDLFPHTGHQELLIHLER